MQKAVGTVRDTSESCRKNYKITCYGKHISLCFWSGSRGNEIVVENDEKVKVTTVKQTWWEWLKGLFSWDTIFSIGSYFVLPLLPAVWENLE